MSRYQPKIIINNPEKNVSDDINAQFFLTLKTGDIDNIKQFISTNKIKINIVEKNSRNTPVHTILSLDSKVADNDSKMQIIQYLVDNGAPVDLPNFNDIWPIHLAVKIQNMNIMNFLIKKGAQINRKDSSGNTPLHWSITGDQIECPKKISIGSLIPDQGIDKLFFNDTLLKTTDRVLDIMKKENSINEDIIHMINTINKIPLMYENTEFNKDISNKVINIFVDVINNPSYSGGLKEQTAKLNQQINLVYSHVVDDLLSQALGPIQIGPNNTGWGPDILEDPLIVKRSPNKLEQILPNTIEQMEKSFELKINNEKQRLMNDQTSPVFITQIEDIRKFSLDTKSYLIELLLNENQCRDITYLKILYLLSFNDKIMDYKKNLIDKFMKNYCLIDDTQFEDVSFYNTLYNQYEFDIRAWLKDKRYTLDEVIDYFPTDMVNNYILEHADDKTIYPNDFCLVSNTFENGLINLDIVKNDLINRNEFDNLFLSTIQDHNLNTNCLNYEGWFQNYYKQYFDIGDYLDVSFSRLYNLYPEMEFVKNQISRLPVPYNNPDITTWFDLLDYVIKDVKPIRIKQNDKYIYQPFLIIQPDPARNTKKQDDVLLKSNDNFQLPKSFPYFNSGGDNDYHYLLYSERYRNVKLSFMDALRILGTIEIVLYNKTIRYPYYCVRKDDYPATFLEENKRINPMIIKSTINDYDTYADTFHKTLTSTTHSAFRLVQKIFYTLVKSKIREEIETCYDRIINELRSRNADDFLRLIDAVITDYNFYSLIAPDNPKHNLVGSNITPGSKNIWDTTHPIIVQFAKFLDENKILISNNNNIDEIIKGKFIDIDLLNLDGTINISFLRKTIENKTAIEFNNIKNFFTNSVFEDTVGKIIISLIKNNIVFTDFLLEMKIIYDENIDSQFESLKNKDMDQEFYLSETYSRFYYDIYHKIVLLNQFINKLYIIIRDIRTNINKNAYYDIPQIFLPTIISQIIKCVNALIDLKIYITYIGDKYQKISVYFDLQIYNDIIIYFNRFVIDLNKLIASSYKSSIDTVKFHNDVINFLNYNSSYLLSINKNDKLFDTNLTTFYSEFPKLLPSSYYFFDIESILSNYSIDKCTYYDSNFVTSDISLFDFSGTAPFNATFYRNLMNLERINNNPHIYQSIYNLSNANIINVNVSKQSIEGDFLKWDVNVNDIKFDNAFIAFSDQAYIFDRLNGMPPAIKNGLGDYLQILKQKIVQNTIQYVINNRYDGADIANLYNNLKDFGGEKTYNVNDVKIFCIIGKIADGILNKYIEYGAKISINTWINQIVNDRYQYEPLIDVIKKTIETIKDSNYMNISLKDVAKKSIIDNLIGFNMKYKLSQINHNPNNIPYTTRGIESEKNEEFIHYLYKLNYPATIDSKNNAECFMINKHISTKLINSDTINVRNSDGDTPLHLAVEMMHNELVTTLMKKGAKNGFRNNLNKTPRDVMLDMLRQHISYNKPTGSIESSLQNFILPFNDILVSKLLDEKFNNNILDYITLAIPIQLVIYNHMFSIYLHNYRYNIDYDLKNAIINIIASSIEDTYPVDLFTFDNDNEVLDIINKDDDIYNAQTNFNNKNQKKINDYEKQLGILNNQINGMDNELIKTNDPDQRTFIENAIFSLNSKKINIENNIKSLKYENIHPMMDISNIPAYKSILNIYSHDALKRNLDTIDFYNELFGKISINSKEAHLSVWQQYLKKDISRTPSMIFLRLNKFIQNNLYKENMPNIKIISNFMKKVEEYIELKNNLPNTVEENMILKEEFGQIEYLINLIITPSIINILFNTILQSIEEMKSINVITTDLNVIIETISKTEYGGQTIHTYLTNIFPKIAIHYYTNTFDNKLDPNKKITSVSQLFEPILNIIKSTKIILIDDNSILIKNISEYLFPFMDNTYNNFINVIRTVIFGYERYLLNTSRLLQTINAINVSD
uniref:Ankyrin repeat protein n=1 Tax=viral metagenome TaxID=1070528 RepID=A0A6C0LSR1_9ZZZZ